MIDYKLAKRLLINGEPTLLLDKEKVIANIKMMSKKAKRLNLSFRPHFKTHQSKTIASWFRNEGVDKITVSSLKMAEYFSLYGWEDITVAFPVNLHEINKINKLAKKIKLNLLVEAPESVNFLIKNLKYHINIFIKIDVGYNRTGIEADNFLFIKKLIDIINTSGKMSFKGFLTHAGQSYDLIGKEQILSLQKNILKKIANLRANFSDKDLIVSVGDTPTCSIAEDFTGINEIRPGNFVFYDLKQVRIGSCNLKQIAVAMAVPVVAKHKKRNEIIVYGGAVHFSKDYILDKNNNPEYGLLAGFNGNKWTIIKKEFYLKSLSQEHGIVKVDNEFFKKIDIGDVLIILPIHSCLTANLMKQYHTLSGKLIERL